MVGAMVSKSTSNGTLCLYAESTKVRASALTVLAYFGVFVKVLGRLAASSLPEKPLISQIAGPQGPEHHPPRCKIACQTGVGLRTRQAKSGATVRRREWVCTSPKWGKLTMLLNVRIANRRKGAQKCCGCMELDWIWLMGPRKAALLSRAALKVMACPCCLLLLPLLSRCEHCMRSVTNQRL